MADTREWPGFRTTDPVEALGPRAAERDVTYPTRAVSRDKYGPRRARTALLNAHGDDLTSAQAGRRRALANGDFSSLGPTDHILAETIRFVPGGRQTFIGLVQRAARNGDKEALAWWNLYQDLMPVDQKHVELDLVCEASGVTPDRLMAVVVSTAMRAGADAAELVAATTYPSVVRQTVKSALRIGGDHADIAQKDRELLLQHHKFIASPKAGGSVFVNAQANANAAAKANAEPSVPAFADTLNRAMGAHKDVQGEIIDAALSEDT